MQLRSRVERLKINSGLIPSRVKPMIKIAIHGFPALTLRIKRTARRTSRQVSLCRRERHLAGFPHLGEVDRRPVTPKQARYSALIALS